MFRNYFKVAIRNILKQKFFSAINILGMTIGITACLLIILYIADELSFDRFHANADRIYQVGLHGKIAGQDIRTANTCPPMAEALAREVPEVEASTRLTPYFGRPTVKNGDKIFTEEKVFFADSNFFDFFSFRLLEGDPATALREPNTMVLSEAIAQKYFGNESPVGKMLVIGNDNRSCKVTGIVEDTPSNSHFIYSILVSSATSDNLKSTTWLNNYMFTYYLLRSNATVDAVNAKFDALVEKYVGPEVERFMGISMKEMRSQGGEYGYYSTKLTDIHLHSTSQGDIEPGGNITYVYFFGAIGVFIIVIACINFMNLATARSAGRAKEVGLRKTLGSMRGQLIGQFLAESTVYSLAAVLLSFAACFFLLPYFNLLAGKNLEMDVFTNPLFIGAFVVLVLFVGLAAGSYPAFYLTSFNAVEVLKGKVRAGMRSKGVRSLLVVFQFWLSISLIIFTVVVYQQIRFMQEKNMGIDKNNILIIQNTSRVGNNREALRNSLLQETGIRKVSFTNNTFPGVNNTTVFKEAVTDQDHIMGVYYADYDHQEVMRFEISEGRYFSEDFPADSMAIILNEAAVKEFGYTDPIGKEIIYNDDDAQLRLKVIGVMKNFNFESFKDQVRPLAIRLSRLSNNLLVRYEGNPAEVIGKVESAWGRYAANEPLEYSFMDQEFDRLFRAEQRLGTIFSVFSGLAIFIASLGLFALAAFTSEQRTKEIGIRKAMGASVFSLTVLLSKEFTRLVIIAFIPAAVFGWYVSNEWLGNFAYRIQVDPWIIVVSGVAAVIVAWLTVSYQSIRAAASNPVDSLRYE